MQVARFLSFIFYYFSNKKSYMRYYIVAFFYPAFACPLASASPNHPAECVHKAQTQVVRQDCSTIGKASGTIQLF